MHQTKSKHPVRLMAVGSLVALSSTCLTLPASAAPESSTPTDSFGQCLKEPAKTVHHKAASHKEQRWRQDVPPTIIDTLYDTLQYMRTVPGVEAVTHDEWKFFQFIEGHDEISHSEYQFSRQNPGVEEVSHEEYQYSKVKSGQQEIRHSEYQFSRQNPGVEEVSHKEYQFSKVKSGQREVSHQEYKYQKSETQYRFRTRVERPDNTVERKYIKGYDFVDGGTTRVDGKTVAGHWVQSSGWHAIPDVIINVVWGSGGVPSNLLGGSEAHPKGNVPLSTYGGPNVSVPYYASLITIDGGYTDWGPWSNWTTTNPGGDTATRDVESQSVTVKYNDGNWTTDTPGSPWTKVDERKVIDQAATPDVTVYRGQDGSEVNSADDAGWFNDSSFQGWTQFKHKKVVDTEYVAPYQEWRAQDGTATTDVNNAGWFTESTFADWDQFGDAKSVIDEAATPDVTVYRGQDGSEVSSADDAGWFSLATFDGWDQFGDAKKVVDTEYVAPYQEWRAQDGTATTDVNNAGWFTESTFDGWDQFGDTKTVVDEMAVADVTNYLVRDEQGNLSSSTNPADATVFRSDQGGNEGVDTTGWTQFGLNTVTDQEATPSVTFYLTQDEDGNFGETEDPELATWILADDYNGVDTTIWAPALDEQGNPVVYTFTESETIPGYTVYYVSDGEPTLELGESNWTTDEPEGWTFVDKRNVVDKDAWDEKIPAEYGPCELPKTGSDPMGAAGIGLLAMAGGAGLVLMARRRGRHIDYSKPIDGGTTVS